MTEKQPYLDRSYPKCWCGNIARKGEEFCGRHMPDEEPPAPHSRRIVMTEWDGRPQTPGGWDGYPENRERDGWHWVLPQGWTTPFVAQWINGANMWVGNGSQILWRTAAKRGWRYIGPCSTPAKVAARVAAARREGIEVCLAEARAEMQGLTTEGEEDAVGNVIDRIRALLEGGR